MEATSDADEEDDNDFDEVPEKEGYEPHIPEHLRAEYGQFNNTNTHTHAHHEPTDTCINNDFNLQKKTCSCPNL